MLLIEEFFQIVTNSSTEDELVEFERIQKESEEIEELRKIVLEVSDQEPLYSISTTE